MTVASLADGPRFFNRQIFREFLIGGKNYLDKSKPSFSTSNLGRFEVGIAYAVRNGKLNASIVPRKDAAMTAFTSYSFEMVNIV